MKKFKVSAIIHGELIKATSDGTKEGTVFETTQENINMMNYYVNQSTTIDIRQDRGYEKIQCGYGSPFALTATLFSLDPPRAILWSAPKEVIDYINSGHGCGRIIISDYIEENGE